jgi:hypothetical protein
LRFSDQRNKEIAFGRIKRLANAGLLLEPFVLTLLKLLDDGIPSSPLKGFLAIPNGISTFICNAAELYAQLPLAKKSFFNANVNPADFGARRAILTDTLAPIWSSKTVLPFEETMVAIGVSSIGAIRRGHTPTWLVEKHHSFIQRARNRVWVVSYVALTGGERFLE